MAISQAELQRQLATARAAGWDAICAEAEEGKGLPAGLLLAIASRETDMQDVVGDGGHGRGLFQIDDRAWPEWLAAHGAGAQGATPPVADAARHAAWILSDNLAFGRRHGVPPPLLLKFAVSGYNAGPGGALAGFEQGNSDLRTTGGDYAADVLDRLARMRGRPHRRRPAGRAATGDGILRVGSSGDPVTALKRRLERWFELDAPGEWDAFGVEPGPAFTAALERAVRVFQERRGLLVDGEVGPQTLGALGLAPAAQTLPGTLDLVLPAPVKRGSGGVQIRLVQGWLSLGGFQVAVDGEFGPATQRAVRELQEARGLPVTGVVDQVTFDALTAPMRRALQPLSPRGRSLGELTVAYAQRHLAAGAREVGGQNRGPWVRLYTGGMEGPDWPWCAGFATFCLRQAAATLGAPMPLPSTLSCDAIAAGGRAAGSFLASPGAAARKRIAPGSFFLRRDTSGRLQYAHTGLVTEVDADSFRSIEGNTNDDGSAEGYEVCARIRGYGGMDFVLVS
jgi:peptidoglycan hydrolase-like protein with peptidoglycan-binding domain